MHSFARHVTDIFSAPSNKQISGKYVKGSGWSWFATAKLHFRGQRICPLSWNWSSFPNHKKTPRKTKNRPQLHPQHNVFFSNFSHGLWLLILNTEWLRAHSGQLCVSIDIKSRICHVPQWVEGGAGVNLWAKLRCWWCSADRWLKCWWSCGSHMQNRRLPHSTRRGFKPADRLSLF